jgi:ribonuclease HIII
MNTEAMIALTHFKILLAHETGQRFSIEQFVGDKKHARQLLSAAEDSDQEKLILAALKLRELLALWPEAEAVSVPVAAAASVTAQKKYVTSLR